MELKRLDAIVQFLSATPAALNDWTQPIPNNVLVYCPETRIIKLGEGLPWDQTPVFLDFDDVDSINLIAQQLQPRVDQLEIDVNNINDVLVTLMDTQSYTATQITDLYNKNDEQTIYNNNQDEVLYSVLETQMDLINDLTDQGII